jgi:chromosome segregation ATPase
LGPLDKLKSATITNTEFIGLIQIEVTGERDDLKKLLVATLQRLEAVDRVVARADDSNSALERRVHTLEEERNRAVQEANSAKSRIEALKKSQRRVEWQNKVSLLLMLNLAHNSYTLIPHQRSRL